MSATVIERRLPRPDNVSVKSETRRPSKVAYVVSRFPKLTETFVLYEIVTLEHLGVDVEVYPLLSAANANTDQDASLWKKALELLVKPKAPAVMHAEAVRWQSRANYHPFLSPSVLFAQVWFLLCRPRTYFAALSELVKGTWGSTRFLLAGLASFPKIVYFARQMERRGVTHVHAHFANQATAAAFVIHRLTGIPYTFTAHGSDLHKDRRMLREKVRDAKEVLTISNFNRDVIVQECGEHVRDKVRVLHCGVDMSVFRPSQRHQQSQETTFHILAVGTMHEVKGQTYLIEACRLLKQRGVELRCHFVGEGPDRPALEAQVAEAGLTDQVIFHGLLTRDAVSDLMQRVDAMAAPSVPTASGRREGIPVVLMEAMACAVPVVASRLSGIPELVDDQENGLLVAPRDAVALADALHRLQQDAALRHRFGVSGRDKVLREFDLTNNGKTLAELFGATISPC